MTDETLIYFGAEVKALDDAGRIGGHLVLWGAPDAHDVTETRDYFTPETDFWDDLPATKALIYHHGLDGTIGARKLGSVELKADDAGLWMEGQLKLRDDYERKIFEAVKRGKLGLSSGSASHLVRREKQPNGAHKITSWPIVEASITPTPGEPRTLAVALKSLVAGGSDDDAPGAPPDTFSETLKAAASALERGIGFAKVGESKRHAVDALGAALKAWRAKHAPIDPAELANRKAKVHDLLNRLGG